MFYSEKQLRNKVRQIKRESLELCLRGGYGHPTSIFSCAEICVVLYYNIIRIDKNNPKSLYNDRFILSKNHAGVIMHPILHDLGVISEAEYDSVFKEGSDFTNHTSLRHNGQWFTGGALGIGLPYAIGMALGAKLNRNDYFTFVITGDAELYEGSMWEAIMFAGAQHLSNLVVFVDRNQLGVSDFTENMLPLESLEDKFKSFNWDVKRINGHSIPQLLEVTSRIRTRPSDKPLCIICDTVKGHGVPFMENIPLWHGNLPKESQIEIAFKDLEDDSYEC